MKHNLNLLTKLSCKKSYPPISKIFRIIWSLLFFYGLIFSSRAVATDQITISSASTSYRIELYPNCSALWQITYSIPLLDEKDVKLFEEYVQNFTSSKQSFIDSFKKQIIQVVGQASNLTGREMYAIDFDAYAMIVSTPTVSKGTITYSFLWVGFLEETKSVLYMGDVFEGGLYLYENDSIYVVPPFGYRADFVSPKPDAFGSSIVWHGPKNFPSGEPAIEFLSMETRLYIEFESLEVVEGEELTIHGRIEPKMAVPIMITYTKPDGRTLSQKVMLSGSGSFVTKIVVDEPGTWYVQATWEGDGEYLGCSSQKFSFNVRSSLNPYPYALLLITFAILLVALVWRSRRSKEILYPPEDDEERVLALLRSSGGQMLQRDISRMLGFSKSKTTGILNDLEAKNLIEKVKKGRNYIVKLR
ncbi:MAG: helix-turn-helix transcriptional regulator [Thermoproteota archaeon]